MSGYQIATDLVVKGSPLYQELKAECDRLRADNAALVEAGRHLLYLLDNPSDQSGYEDERQLINAEHPGSEMVGEQERRRTAEVERDEARAEADLLRELFQEAMGWIPKVQALKGLVDSDPVKVLRPDDIKGAEGILKRRPE